MSPSPVLRESILPRISGIQKNLMRLQKLGELSFKTFCEPDNYDLAQHHLRLALEGVGNISSHIVSRVPGVRAVEYKAIARAMGECSVVPQDFASEKLVPMAGMRNILVHAYADLKPRVLYNIVSKHMGDIEIFLQHIKKFLKRAGKLGFVVK